jgi:glutamyl/glutaminyl-tRNA synthetase
LGVTTSFEDIVFGKNETSNDEIEDFVLLRSPKDGSELGLPTYQLGAVVDDIEMRITHVIRGADHISNTPKQVMLYRALGAEVPKFAHVPLILGPDRKRLSKRHGATSVASYEEEGFIAEAFRNFLCLLGWSTGDDSEFMRTDELLKRFSLEGVSRTNGVFDRANWNALESGAQNGTEPRRNGLRMRWICCVRAHICLRILRNGRSHFSATHLNTIRQQKKNSGRMRDWRGCWGSWRTR